jgi:hypothetical protein
MLTAFSIPRLEFYITNVCNLNCTNCNRGNNFLFKGHQRWNDYADAVHQWANRLRLEEIGILGGEPLLNPDFDKWLTNIADLWPDSKIVIMTNGTQLDRWPQLYDIMASGHGRLWLQINCHNLDSRANLIDSIDKFYPNGCEQYDDGFHPSGLAWGTWKTQILDDDLIKQRRINTMSRWIDRNRVKVEFKMADAFNISTIRYDPVNSTLSLHESDPTKAMARCYFKRCHHISKGRLYKCGPTAILPDFVKQFDVKATARQLQLIDSYQPASPDWPDNELESFIGGLVRAEPIDQCSLCPTANHRQKIYATNQKIKFVKRSLV